MFRISKLFILVLVAGALALLSVENVSAITRTARKLNMVEFFGGINTPHGEYDGLVNGPFLDDTNSPISLDANQWLDNSFFLGLSYGALYGGNSLFQIGIRYSDYNVDRSVIIIEGGIDYSYYQLDLDVGYKYLLTSLNNSTFSPHIGASASAGFTTLNPKGFQSESELNIGFSLEFGGDLKIWSSADNSNFLTLASANNYNLLSSNSRIKNLNLGLGIRYYFRP
ncbi:MAG: hypothetical protein IIC66_00740 [candidate division Zixibacteria bacterium]|nr:hypothetical protein [candidate division Zixibacteria bacterium]